MAATREQAKPQKQIHPAPAFVELIGPTGGAAIDCRIEVESERGVKVRLQLKGIATAELAGLIRRFLGQ